MEWYVYLIIVIAGFYFILSGVKSIRCLLWSIVWCDRGGKHNRTIKLKKGRGFIEKFKMEYLQDYVSEHAKQFHFWLRMKKIYEFIFLLSSILTLVMFLMYSRFSFVIPYYAWVWFGVSFVLSGIASGQFDGIRQKTSKYDRLRLSRRKRKNKPWWLD